MDRRHLGSILPGFSNDSQSAENLPGPAAAGWTSLPRLDLPSDLRALCRTGSYRKSPRANTPRHTDRHRRDSGPRVPTDPGALPGRYPAGSVARRSAVQSVVRPRDSFSPARVLKVFQRPAEEPPSAPAQAWVAAMAGRVGPARPRVPLFGSQPAPLRPVHVA